MKKIIVLLLSVLILAGAVMPAAANSVTATTACTTAADSIVRGDTVTVTVSLSNCAKLKSMALTPSYDSNVFELVSGEWLLKDAMLSSFDTEKGHAAIAYSAEKDANGDIFKFILKVKDTAPFGKTSLKANPVVKNGSVSIECQATEKTVTVNCSHSFDSNWSYDANQHWKGCLVDGCDEKTETANHTFDDDCDATCNVCGYTRTVIHSYSEVWSHDDTNHWHECTVCGDKKDTATHSGGTATCNEKALCSFCGVSYGDFAKHTYTEKAEEQYLKSAATCVAKAVYYKSCSVCGVKSTETFQYGEVNFDNHTGGTYLVGQKETSCYEEGYTGDTYCSGCNEKIATGTSIPKSDHNPASVWTTDETYHWKTCETIGCGNLIDKAEHSGGEATCTAKAVCEVCHVAYGTVDANNHKNTEIRGAYDATCNTPGYTGDTWCKDCNTKIADGTTIPATGNHVDANGKWEYNDTQHFHTCDCGTEFDKADHTGGTATCKDKAVCEVCGASYGKLAPESHAGGTEVRGYVPASCNTPGYTGDTYCLGCNEKIADGTTIPATGNHVDADGDWEHNDTQHFHTCACGTEFDKADHTGGTATCKDKAVCEVCGAAYGTVDTTNHAGGTYLVGQKETSCYEEGYTGDTYCSGCDEKIATGTSIPKSDHNPASVWSTDETYHWKTCETIGCGNLIDKAEHSGGEATCTAKAVCEVCHVAYGTVDANNHKNTEIRGAYDATCNTPGYTGDTWCKDCNTKIADGTTIPATGKHVDANGKWEHNDTQHFHTCACGTEFDKADHTGGTATCKDKAVCEVCGASYGKLAPESHAGGTEVRGYVPASCNAPGYTGDTYCLGCNEKIADGTTIPATGNHVDADGDWEHNDTQHFHTCACGTEFDKADHTGGTATCKDKAVCEVCGAVYGTVNATNHTGETYLVGEKKTSCDEAGYTGDTHCSGCDAKLSNGKSIEKIPHVIKEWNVTKNATTDECGEKSGTCGVCKKTITVTTAKLVSEVKDDNIEGIKAEVESVGNTNLSEDVYFVANEVLDTINATEKTKVEDAIKQLMGSDKEFKFGAIFDLKFILREMATNGDVINESKFVLDGTVKVTIPVSTEVFDKLSDMKLVHIKDDGTSEFIPFTLKDGKVIFEAKEFSYYTFVGTEKAPAGNTDGDNNSTDKSPQTGENSNLPLWIALLFVSASSLTALAVINKKKKQSR